MREKRICSLAVTFYFVTATLYSSPIAVRGQENRAGPAQNRERGSAGHTNDAFVNVLSIPAEDVSVEQWLEENGWKVQRGNIASYSIEGGSLLMKNIDATTVIGKRFDPTIDPTELPLIEFRVRVDEIPVGTDVTTRNMDDAAFRLLILFDRGGGFLSPPETIGYVWDSTMEPGDRGRSNKFAQIRYIAIGSGTRGLGEWKSFERNIADDYSMLFGTDEIPDIAAVALKCDSNHSGTVAASRIQWIRMKPLKIEHR